MSYGLWPSGGFAIKATIRSHASACRKLATQSAELPEGPEGRALKRTVAALHFLPRAEPLPAKCVLHLYASDHAETVCHYSEMP